MTTIIGIDPGSRYTGLVIVDSDGHLRAHTTITRKNTMTDTSTYLPWLWQQVVTELRKPPRRLEGDTVLAIEDIVEPKPIRRGNGQGPSITNPRHAIDTAKVFGYLAAKITEQWAGRFVVITPNRHGDRHDGNATVMHALYPPQLIGPRETTGTGHGKYHHQRAAWDVADTARQQLKLEQMRRRA